MSRRTESLDAKYASFDPFNGNAVLRQRLELTYGFDTPPVPSYIARLDALHFALESANKFGPALPNDPESNGVLMANALIGAFGDDEIGYIATIVKAEAGQAKEASDQLRGKRGRARVVKSLERANATLVNLLNAMDIKPVYQLSVRFA